MTDDAWAVATATEQVAAIRKREIAPSELLELHLDRIARLDEPINAVVTLDAERARTAARRADDAVARGEELGALHGLSVTIKDAIATEGIRSTGGAIELRDHVPAEDAPVVAALKRAGAIVFGKTNVPRWSGDLQTFNEMFGRTNNPWDLARSPGGSSGGPAAAVACGFTSFEVGTDIGGSIRNPSHFTGVFGLKPSFGVVPQRGYLDNVAGGTTDADINVFGPIARSAEDLALILEVIAGPLPEHAAAWRLELPAPAAMPRGLRVAVWLDDSVCPVAREELALLRRAADALAGAGAHVETVTPPVEPASQLQTFWSMIGAAVSPSMPDEVGETMGSHRTWLRWERERAAMRATWARWFEAFDVLLCPVTPTAALPHDTERSLFERAFAVDGIDRPFTDNITWNGLIGILGLPSAVPPIGRTDAGLPVGVQVVAPFLRDRTAVAAAGVLGDLMGGHAAPPGFA